MSLQYQGKQVEELIYNLAYIEFQIYFPYFRYSYSLPKPVKNFAIREGERKAVESLVVSKMNVAENTKILEEEKSMELVSIINCLQVSLCLGCYWVPLFPSLTGAVSARSSRGCCCRQGMAKSVPPFP